MEITTRYTAVYGKGSKGCRRHARDIMIAVGDTNGDLVVHDIFLTQDQAAGLVLQLQERIAENLKRETALKGEE